MKLIIGNRLKKIPRKLNFYSITVKCNVYDNTHLVHTKSPDTHVLCVAHHPSPINT